MSNHTNLIFFNKEGDNLNISYNQNTDRFESDLLFHENSNDVYKTIALYTLEKVPSFEFELPGELTTNKFQLFNQYGIHFYGAISGSQSITKIESINNDSEFYSKWIYGDDFESKFPIGSIIKFDKEIFEFNDLNRTYTVVSNKKNAIMIISQMDNSTFEINYYQDSLSGTSYTDKTISGINLIGVYNYVSNQYSNNLSAWNEPDFYDKFYPRRKLNIVNSLSNDSTVTVKETELTDLAHFEYFLGKSNFTPGSEVIMEVITRMDLPKIFEGELKFVSSTSHIEITDLYAYPQILKPGKEFKVIGSSNNSIFLTVASIPEWKSIVNTTYFATQSQVIYNNRIFQCVTGYTQSFGQDDTKFITPDSKIYWSSLPTYIKVEQFISDEDLLFGQIYLTTDRFYYSYGWTFSNEVTLASFAEKYAEDLKLFNIDLYYKNNALRADLMYPSKYAVVNFYQNQIAATSSVGKINNTLEKVVSVVEKLNYELNYDYSENFKYNIVFTDIDEFGIKIVINKQVYEVEVAFVFTGSGLDMERTIDRTLRNWLARNFIPLYRLGITAELKYIGNFTSIFYNSIQVKSQYPNVPILVNEVEVGITADYYIEHSTVIFTGSGSPATIGPVLTININDKDYQQVTKTASYLGQTVTDVPATLSAWVAAYAEDLLQFGIIAANFNSLLKFNIKRLDRRFEYTISTGKVNLPGLRDFVINKKYAGNHGTLISSNEVSLPKESLTSFETSGFSTGMVFSINNTIYPYNNQEYNIQFLDPTVLNLSYQGPFWSLTQSICNSSAFVNLAFTLGFGQTACIIPTPVIIVSGASGSGGEFDMAMFDESMFTLSYNTNVYNINSYNLSSYPGTSNLIDIMYIQLANSVCAFGDDFVSIDSSTGQFLASVLLPGNTQSIGMKFNPINSYVYCLSSQQIHVIDPVMNVLISRLSLTASGNYNAFQMEVNPTNGDLYVTYRDWNRINIWSFDNLTSTPTSFLSTVGTRTGALVFNAFESDMYVTTDANAVLRINSNRTLQTTYGITGVTHSIFYEPVNESVYVYTLTNLWKIDNGIPMSIASMSSYPFTDVKFNVLTGEINISDSSQNFTRLNLDTNEIKQTSVANYGYIEMNPYDGDVYLSSQNFNNIIVVRPKSGIVIHTEPMAAPTTRLVYNLDRTSIWALQPSLNTIVELEVELNNVIDINPSTFSQYSDNQYGTLAPNYKPRPSIWLKTREYIRRPRENFEGDVSVKYYYKWLSDNVPEMFMYDFSGEQLPKTGPYAYTGPKPLTNAILQSNPNKDKTKLDKPQFQQTIFDKIEWALSYIDDEDDLSSEVEPLQLFLGFKSPDEGAIRSILQLYKKEEIEFDIISDITTNLFFESVFIDGVRVGKVSINEFSSQVFTGRGLKPGQPVVIYLKDVTNDTNQYISENSALLLRLRAVYTKVLIFDFYNPDVDFFETETTAVVNYPTIGSTTYLKFTLKVKDREIGRFQVFGQTEVEDIRFKTELGNVGKLIGPDEVFIFKEYDINEGGIDWIYLNKKRKEMLMNKHLIYSYVGAYKSIINAINYFGYNDLQLNEYFRNINPQSSNFDKLFKIEIPDIFDNSIQGWSERPFAKMDLANGDFEATKMFNLTYNITDRNGLNILNYSLDEIIIKLQGLKYWLKRNIIPLTHKILDITGKAAFTGGNQIQHKVSDVRIFKMKSEMTPVTFKLNEAYLMPVNSGSTVYNCVLDFYSIIPGLGASYSLLPEVTGPKPYNEATLFPPEYFDVKIRTYKTYKEWAPYVNYNKGDKVTYFEKIYESQVDNNKIKNPRKFESASAWSPASVYVATNIVEYRRDYYVYSALGTANSNPPNLDTLNWLKITEWKEIDKEPVQIINEWRNGVDMRPFNFTLDSNIDPFVVIEVTSDNGYGCVYRDKKNYEIRGIKDLQEPYRQIEPIGPFVPINPVY
jgi:hypothetical protein